MYSLPTRMTLAAFTIASAASTAPIRPWVSIIPNASSDMARTLTDCRRCGNCTMLVFHHALPNVLSFIPRGAVPADDACRPGCRLPFERVDAFGRHAHRHAGAVACGAWESTRRHLQVRRRAGCAFRSGLSRDGPHPGQRGRTALDRRSHAADANHAVEAGPDRRIYADDLRADSTLRRRGDYADRSVYDDQSKAPAADG